MPDNPRDCDKSLGPTGRCPNDRSRHLIRLLGRLAVSLVVATGLTGCQAKASLFGLPPAHPRQGGAGVGVLGLRSVQLGQSGTQFELRVKTHGRWSAHDIVSRPGRSLCLLLLSGTSARPRARVCVAEERGVPRLSEIGLDAGGAPVGHPLAVSAHVTIDREAVLEATFTPAEIGLPYGRYRWAVESHWTDGLSCATEQGCSDRVPSTGSLPARARLLAEPDCFGAAARDPLRPCANERLRRLVLPTPEDAPITPSARCAALPAAGLVSPCSFGVSAQRAKGAIALIGDSHASAWRGAVEIAAQAFRWRGTSITRSGCPFTRGAVRIQTPAARQGCARWVAAVTGWLGRHPEIHTVFTAAYSENAYLGDPAAGFAAAFRALPRSVRKVIVLRDDPVRTQSAAPCLEDLLRRHAVIGHGCSEPRSVGIRTDPAAVAASTSSDPRWAAVDLTSLMCSATRCFPVVGGVLVHKDTYSHLTSVFATTLGPFLLRELASRRLT
jgi:hypothetical protein